MSVWQPKRTEELKFYLADKVIESFQMMVYRLKSDKVTVDDVALFSEVEAAIVMFRKNIYPDMP